MNPIILVLYFIFLAIFVIISVFIFRYIVKFSYLSPRFTSIVFVFAGLALMIIIFSLYILFVGMANGDQTLSPGTPKSSNGLSF